MFLPTADTAALRDRVELVLERAPPRRTSTFEINRDDKLVADQIRAFWWLVTGRRLYQWDIFTLVLADALSNPEGQLVRLGFSRSQFGAPSAVDITSS